MTTFTHLAGVVTAMLFSSVWESASLVLCVAILLRLIPSITAAARSLIWSAVFLLTLALPFAGLVSGGSSAHTASSLQFDPRWAVGVAATWACLSILRAVRLLQSGIRLHNIASRSTPLEPAANIAVLLGAIKPNVSLCTSSEVDTPSVAGFFHRRILLPCGLAEHIAPADLHQIVLHELGHLRRRDDWTNLVQKLALVLFPLHPILLWVERRLCVERELACDDEVLHTTDGAVKAYATCLANLAEASTLRRGLSLALGAWQGQSELGRRVQRILQNPVRQMKPAQSAALASLVLSAIIGTGVLAIRSPQLITFGSPLASSFTEQANTTAPQLLPVRTTQVRAGMAEPRLNPVALRVPVRQVKRSRHRVAAGGPRSNAPRAIVLIEWQPDRSSRRLAVAHTFQLTYAAVPTRGGWLFFQL